jgi:DNA-binding NtrC family response regulator
VNLANALPSTRFSALLIESDKGLGLESTLRDQGCAVRRATNRAAAQEALEGVDIVVISSAGFADDEILDLISKSTPHAAVVLVTEKTDLAVKAAKQGASTALGGAIEIASAQISQALSVSELKKKMANKNGPLSFTAPTSGVVQRRSTPLPKEATPDALDALIEAAEGLVPMHRFQRVYVDYALRRFGGNKVHTAAALGIDRRTIQRWARARAEQQRPEGGTHASTSSSS